ncbi:NUDIX hydrolase [bacterium]|nr:NUDIX hydrolase [bacterium]
MKKNWLPQKKYIASLPTKRISVGVMFFNRQNKLLILKPNYRRYWILVGGTVDKNESPLQAAKREVKEEINFSLKKLQPVSVSYKRRDAYMGEAVYWLFYGGILTDKQIKNIKLQVDEMDDYKFVSIKQAVKILNNTAGPRLLACMKAIKNKNVIYMENNKIIE